MKRKLSNKGNIIRSSTVPLCHDFSETEVTNMRFSLLEWYRKNKRDLPWRKQACNPDVNQRVYAVWVSEIMLQQTQVATVIDYYNKWMKRWPTFEDLSKATLEEVNEMWAGLGYYSRGRRLFEGAKKVVEELGGQMPQDAESLLKQLPGVGRYTAGAIASIAYNQATGLVDGNVIRVLCRLRIIGGDSTSQPVTDALWQHAERLVDPDAPGDFNQAMMELGAVVCTPKNPDCNNCPLKNYCKAYFQVQKQKQENGKKLVTNGKSGNTVLDIECTLDGCHLCLTESDSYDKSLGVMNYPRKGRKKEAREERTAVCILCRRCSDNSTKYFIVQRPKKGLLAGMWEFPSLLLESEDDSAELQEIISKYGLTLSSSQNRIQVGEVVHIFSHIHQTYVVHAVIINDSDVEQEVVEDTTSPTTRWVTKEIFMEAAVSTAMKKVFKAFEGVMDQKPKVNKKLKPKDDPKELRKQKAIDSFFKPKSSN
ncbi:hypothetical protein ACJMK2_041291 [Sinanodonta woodiana]|uniref:Adenine DNA glycosylase n=1 Tax=Sinanodonta woodiana TaxID=1069815 RepID=A0ABD3W3N5_SINWO